MESGKRRDERHFVRTTVGPYEPSVKVAPPVVISSFFLPVTVSTQHSHIVLCSVTVTISYFTNILGIFSSYGPCSVFVTFMEECAK
jgi:hypothetical protein